MYKLSERKDYTDIFTKTDIPHNIGGIDGYKTNVQEERCLKNFLDDFDYLDSLYSLNNTYNYVAILKNLVIEEEYRSKGYGKKLIKDFIKQCSDTEAIFLIADTGVSNNFDLVKWYQKLGFKVINSGDDGEYPLMMKVIRKKKLANIA